MNAKTNGLPALIAGGYLIVTGIVITLEAITNNELWSVLNVALTLPWSIPVTMLSWSLTHTGMDSLALLACAALNAAIIGYVASLIFRSTRSA